MSRRCEKIGSEAKVVCHPTQHFYLTQPHIGRNLQERVHLMELYVMPSEEAWKERKKGGAKRVPTRQKPTDVHERPCRRGLSLTTGDGGGTP